MENNLNNFTDRVCADIEERLPEYDFRLQKVEKLQNHPYTGLLATKKAEQSGVIVKLDDYFEKLLSGGEYGNILDEIEAFIKKETEGKPVFRQEDLTDYESVKGRLELQVVPTEKNLEVLKTVPHRNILDLSLVCRIAFGKIGTALVNLSMLDAWTVTEEQLFADALSNMGKPQIRKISEILEELTGMKVEDNGKMWVTMNGKDRFGASVLADPGFFDEAAELLKKDFFVIPSSIHELILMPDTGEVSADHIRETVMFVNESEVPEEDRLSDDVYHYEITGKVFETAADFSRRTAEKENGKLVYRDRFGDDISITRVSVGIFGKKCLPVAFELYTEEGPYAMVTKDFGNCSGNDSIVMPFCAWIDTNNNPGIESFLIDNGIAEPYMRFGEPVTMQSGFCTYPYYQFKKEKLSELDPEGTEKYMRNWEKAQEKALMDLIKGGRHGAF